MPSAPLEGLTTRFAPFANEAAMRESSSVFWTGVKPDRVQFARLEMITEQLELPLRRGT